MALKLTVNSVQQHVRLVFANNILFVEKIILSLYSSCSRIVYSGLKNLPLLHVHSVCI